MDIRDIPFTTIDGDAASLADYAGQVVMIVNVASRCGLTPQYEQLEALQREYGPRGFTVLGFPCNQFAGQEPGDAEDIKQFCSMTFGVTFPLMEKVHVKGEDQHPLYARLTGKGAEFPGDIKWNFGKFLIGRDGQVLKRFEPQTKPDSEEVVKAIENALATK